MATYRPVTAGEYGGEWTSKPDLDKLYGSSPSANGTVKYSFLGEKSNSAVPNSISINPQGVGSNTQMSIFSPAVKPGPPPAAPDYTNLQSVQSRVEKMKALKGAMREFDEMEASTLAMGSQTAENAGRTYANRLAQTGVNPVASGMVAAQAKMPMYGQLAEIGVQKQTTKLDAVQKADSLAAQIASNIANIQLGYTKMLADWNQQNAGYQLDLNKFNAAQSLDAQQFNETSELERAKLAAAMLASGSGKGGAAAGTGAAPYGNFNPGYITSSGPINPATLNGGQWGNGRSVSLATPTSWLT